jgi:hypothetical protein
MVYARATTFQALCMTLLADRNCTQQAALMNEWLLARTPPARLIHHHPHAHAYNPSPLHFRRGVGRVTIPSLNQNGKNLVENYWRHRHIYTCVTPYRQNAINNVFEHSFLIFSHIIYLMVKNQFENIATFFARV